MANFRSTIARIENVEVREQLKAIVYPEHDECSLTSGYYYNYGHLDDSVVGEEWMFVYNIPYWSETQNKKVGYVHEALPIKGE